MSDRPFSSFRAYDPNGLQVTFSFPFEAESVAAFGDADVQATKIAIQRVLANGFTVNPPDAEEGEEIKTVGFFAKRVKFDRNGEEIPVIDVYSDTDNPEFKYKMITLYINNSDDAREFEEGTGIKISDIPFYDGDQPLERWSPKAPKYLLPAVRKPTRIGLRHNSAYNPTETDPKLKKPQWKFSRWLAPISAPGSVSGGSAPAAPATGANTPGRNDDPERPPFTPTLVKDSKAASPANGTPSSAGSRQQTTANAPHWASDEASKQKIADAFASLGIIGTPSIQRAMHQLEPGVKRLSESRIASADAYIAALRAHYAAKHSRAAGDLPGDEEFKGWTDALVAQFEQRLALLYPDIRPADIRDALGVNAWIEAPGKELARIAKLAAEQGWRVTSEKVGYHQGATAQDTYIVFQTPIGPIRFYSRTKLAEQIGAGWARANGVERWQALGDEEIRAIEPAILTWEAKSRQGDGGIYRVAERVEAVDKIDAMLQS